MGQAVSWGKRGEFAKITPLSFLEFKNLKFCSSAEKVHDSMDCGQSQKIPIGNILPARLKTQFLNKILTHFRKKSGLFAKKIFLLNKILTQFWKKNRPLFV